MSDVKSEADRFDQGNKPIVKTYGNATRGLFTCANRGLIVAHGPTQQLTDAPEFDTVYCHEDDEAEVLRILIESREHSSKSLIARFQNRFSIAG